ncbi:N-acetylmuramoyl-L-alanine amidase [Oceanobacillus salinisoli]|uniref:N-acetylmuramoyl-L-alanine amidase n=1 Tax=Oceanobacillus salinisoli TaxID=2678611 RepID=UPI0012E15C31|nr:N-acetylmuramoyl-L-alanine amidase [Oceanobacillus salinisoli]
MKSIRSLITLGFSLLLLLVPVTGHAENGQTYEVSTTVLNVRSGPSANADILGILTKGNQLKTFQEKYGWVQTYYGGKEAWVAKHYLIPLHKQTNTTVLSSETITVTAEGVNIRSGPGESYSIIGSVTTGETYNLVQTEEDWHQISFSNGNTGWIASWLTSKDTTNNNAEDSTNKTGEETEGNTPTSTNSSLAGYHIVIDPGHGGNDPGAIGFSGVYEKDLITSTADKVAQQLSNAGATVTMTRTGDYYVSLEERSRISNGQQTDAFISLHYNSFPILSAQGINTYYYGTAGRELAQDVHNTLLSTVTLRNRGIEQENFHVLRNTAAPAILIELGFITNPYDTSIVKTADYQNKVAQSITNGLVNYFQ